MQLDEVTAEIRPRSDWEAVDLGFAMIRRDFWRCFTGWWLAMLGPLLIAGWFFRHHPSLLLLLFWWWKPAGSRMVLFELSRRLFGEKPAWKSVWREIPRVWWRRFFYRFIWARFSPWLPVTLAVEDLEGLRGKPYRQRCGQIVRRGDGVVMAVYFTADAAAAWFGVALLILAKMLIPQGQEGPLDEALASMNAGNLLDIPPLIMWIITICLMISISLTDLFVIGAGFGLYINNRTWIEGWDVELAFRRLTQRLSKVAVILLGLFLITVPMTGMAQESQSPQEVVMEVKRAPEFKVYTIKERVAKEKPPATPPAWLESFFKALGGLLGAGKVFGNVLIWSIVGLLLALLGWLIWKFRHSFVFRGNPVDSNLSRPSARVVMGMEVTPESLPADVPAAAWLLWLEGKHQEALGLLYRGAISKSIELARVEIQESDTEGDCVRRVESAGTKAHPEYFRSLTGTWIRQAYAGTVPAEIEVRSLCDQWPFSSHAEGRTA